ncbi:hypothetical protein Sango_2774200 [Sesamum angolense]|uniref:Uncharacterized protein n=1 Tax=Sesamum angolense TaxID=2727404 RepID=A0AAE1T884_9LAMI|nr:hypothetical protein Sango_2774200 [Sesamum angolense]
MNANTKLAYTQILVASSIGLIMAEAMHYHLKKILDQRIIPCIKVATDKVLSIERCWVLKASRKRSLSTIVTAATRRAIMCGRALRVNSQLKSHKRFADAFTTYCQLVDYTAAMDGKALLSSTRGPIQLLKQGLFGMTQFCHLPGLNIQKEFKFSIQTVERMR